MITGNEPTMPLDYDLVDTSRRGVATGLTIRQLFSKDAPDDIPYWFVSVHEDAPKFPEIPADLEESKQNQISGWLHDPIGDLPKDLMFFQELFSEYHKAKYEWDLKTTEERYFQWRTYYADKLIEQLNKTEK